jgi:hypothetical protein
MSIEYEAIRAQVTGDAGLAIPRGLALLMRRGVASWLETCSSLQSAVVRPKTGPHCDTVLSLPPSPELASLLADMAIKRGRLCGAL